MKAPASPVDTGSQPARLRPRAGLRWMLAAWGVAILLVVGARWVGEVVNAQATVLTVAGTPWQTYLGGLRILQTSELYLVDVNTGLKTRLDLRLTSPVPPTFDRLAWSPDNRWLAYVASEPDVFPESPGLLLDGLFIMDFETLVARLYLPDVDHESDLAWSPEGTRLAVAAHVASARASDIFLVEAESREVRNLSSDPGRDVWPQWTFDGQTVVFLSDQDGDWEVYAVDAASGAPRNLTKHPAQDRALDSSGAIPADPAPQMVPSPTGPEVAFVSNRDSAGDIFGVDVVTGQTRLLAAVDGEIRDVSWSPTGRLLAFSTRQTFGSGAAPDEIYVVDVTTGALTNVSRQPDALDQRPVWGGSDRRLIFNSNRAGEFNWAIYVADLVTGEVRPLAGDVTAEPDSNRNDYLFEIGSLAGEGWLPFYSNRQAGRLFVVQAGSGEIRSLDFNSQIFAAWNP